jgi:Ca-activated chloride channel family protein
LPDAAAVDHLRVQVGKRMIEGQIRERVEAKRLHEQAKAQGKRTSLMEQERPNIFTTSVANIGPGERSTVEIEYQETISYENGQYQLRCPMAVGTGYIPGTPVIIEGPASSGSGTALDTARMPDASRITPPVKLPGQGFINPLSLGLSLNPGFPIAKVESPSRRRRVRWVIGWSSPGQTVQSAIIESQRCRYWIRDATAYGLGTVAMSSS